jgi:thymidylate kinase
MIFILIEGADGAGKTTFTEYLVDHLEKTQDVIRLKFPTRLPTDEELERKSSEVLFYLNDFEREMADIEDYDGIVVCDRSFLTTLAYQGFHHPPEKNAFYDAILSLGASSFFENVGDNDELYLIKLECSTDEALERTEIRKEGKRDEELDRVDRMGTDEKRLKIDNLKRGYNVIFNELRNQKVKPFHLQKKSMCRLYNYLNM